MLYGPLIIDIDRENGSYSEGYVQDLNKALDDTRLLIDEYFFNLKKSDIRIFFTGHKGFNVEIKPNALGISSTDNRYQQFRRVHKDINRLFGNSFTDKLHSEIRLHNSINSWISIDGKIMNRMKFEMSVSELKSTTVGELCRNSEMLAQDYLSQ